MKIQATTLLLTALVATASTGCGKSQPTLAGGKPIRYWVEAINDSNPMTRKEAALHLGNVGPTDDAALPALLGAMRDPDPRVRCEVILAVVKFGPDAKQAVDDLTDLKLHDGDAKVRDHASKALAKLARDDGK
jgi:vesicle coat complex subunit